MTDLPRQHTCVHCASPVPAGAQDVRFCCAGCEAVYTLLRDEGLTRYYTLGGGQGSPAAAPARERSLAWLEPLRAQAEAAPGPVCSLELDVQGIHCAACVWLMRELFQREPGGAELTVNPALGSLRLRWRRGELDPERYLRGVERFGYQFGPRRKRPGAQSLDLPIRLGVCAALTMNVMLFSISFYFGLTPQAEGGVFRLFTQLSVALSSVVVLVGGWPFLRAAWQGLRRGVLHLDLPIALGILAVYATSLLKIRDGRGDLAYFDTLNTFVTLMLVGRWLQQRVLERNRRFLLEDDGADGLVARRLVGGALETVPVPRLRAGDELLVAPGDLVPVEAEVLEPQGRFSTDWITGEAAARTVEQGAAVPAGSFNAGDRAARLRARTDFSASPLVDLLRPRDTSGPTREALHARFWGVLARAWVVGVLAFAGLGLVLWWPAGPDRALEVAVALLVVTCPCAIGITLPMAYELVQARLRRAGFFARSTDLLDRLARVRTVLFDKTGTLTLGRLELADRAALAALTDAERDAAYDLAARSGHPVSRALAQALARAGARLDPSASVTEHPGRGLELVRAGTTWRLGAPGWAGPAVDAAGQGDVKHAQLSRDGAAVTTFGLREAARPDARRELAALRADGHDVWLLSGDQPQRVQDFAAALGLPGGRALGGLRPEEKAAHVSALDRQDTLFLGDGVNDSLAFERALCAGTPAIDRPVMPGKADFFLLGDGVAPVREALAAARSLRRATHRILAVALAYNALAISACLLGAMTPLRAAVAMPLSSLSLLGATAWALSGRRGAPAAAAQAPTPPAPVRQVPA